MHVEQTALNLTRSSLMLGHQTEVEALAYMPVTPAFAAWRWSMTSSLRLTGMRGRSWRRTTLSMGVRAVRYGK